LEILDQDLEHESLNGIYMAACVIYATIYHESPEGATYAPSGMSADVAAFLQRVAWESVSKWKAASSTR